MACFFNLQNIGNKDRTLLKSLKLACAGDLFGQTENQVSFPNF